MQTQPITNEQILARTSERNHANVKAEIKIVDALIARASELDYKLAVFARDEVGEYGATGTYDVKSAIFDLFVLDLVVSDENGTYLGFVMLVRGNGSDLISDYSVKLKSFLEPVLELSDNL